MHLSAEHSSKTPNFSQSNLQIIDLKRTAQLLCLYLQNGRW